MITDHVWRPEWCHNAEVRATPRPERGCAYMNCRRPRDEHERAWVPKGGPR